MKETIVKTWPLFFGLGMMMIGNGLQGTLLGIRAGIENFSVLTTGIVMSVYYVGFLFGSYKIPYFVASVGHIRVFAALASVASATVLVHGIVIDPILWCVIRALSGFAFAGLFVVVESWLNDASTNETRGKIMGAYMVVTYVGMALGQLLLNAADPGGVELFVMISILVSLAMVPISLSTRPAPDFSTTETIAIRTIWNRSPLGIFGVTMTGVATAAIFSIAPVYALMMGFDNKVISIMMVAFLVGSVACQMPVAAISDRFDRRKMIVILSLMSAVFAASLVMMQDQVRAIIILMALLGGACLPIYGQCVSHVNDHLLPRQFVASSSTILLCNGMGAAVGPLLVTMLMQNFGAGAFAVFTAICFGLVGLFGIYRSYRSAAIPLEAQSDSILMPARGSSIDLYSEEID